MALLEEMADADGPFLTGVCVCVYVCMLNVCMFTRSHAHTHSHTHTHTHTHLDRQRKEYGGCDLVLHGGVLGANFAEPLWVDLSGGVW